MPSLLERCRQISQIDIKTVLESLKNFSPTNKQILTFFEKLCELLFFVSISILLYTFLSLFVSFEKLPQENSSKSGYSFAQTPNTRLKAISGFDAAGLEGKDPLWLELRSCLEFASLNARPDNPQGQLARFRWTTTNEEFVAKQGLINYFGQTQDQSIELASSNLEATNLWQNLQGPNEAKIAFKVTRVSLEGQQMIVELDIFKPSSSYAFEKEELLQNQEIKLGQYENKIDQEKRSEVTQLQSQNLPATWSLVESVTLKKEQVKRTSDASALQALIRSGCRWYGPDLFLTHHGSDKTPDIKQRLEIGPTNRLTVLYVGAGTGIISKGSEFVSALLGKATQDHTLWTFDQIVDGKLQLTAWNASGDVTVKISLNKQMEPWQPQSIQSKISLGGLRGNDSLLVQIQQDRWNLKVHDWLFKNSKGWEKILTQEQLDQFVIGKLKGELLILKNFRQDPQSLELIASFRLYSPSRSQMHDFELRTSQVAGNFSKKSPSESNQNKESQERVGKSPLREELLDPSSRFIPLPSKEQEMPTWPDDEDRAWQPPTDISPEKMLEILQRMNSENPIEKSQKQDQAPQTPGLKSNLTPKTTPKATP